MQTIKASKDDVYKRSRQQMPRDEGATSTVMVGAYSSSSFPDPPFPFRCCLLTLKRDGDENELLSVWDSGPQIPPENLERVFDRLWRADLARTDATQHAGLGLSLVKSLIELHGGSVSIESTPGSGTTILCRLPVSRHHETADQNAAAASAAAGS